MISNEGHPMTNQPSTPDPAVTQATPQTGAPLNGASDIEVPQWAIPDLSVLTTEDNVPVENIFVEKQQRLLTRPLYSSWEGPGKDQPFLVLANVGFFHTYKVPPLVPDVLLGLDVRPAGDLHSKEGRSYFLWLIGKPPDVVIEIVSDRRGDEEGFKKQGYARAGVLFYVVFDPERYLHGDVLSAYVLHRRMYQPTDPSWLPEVGLGLKLWPGTFERMTDTWLRWCDRQGEVIPTGEERADKERGRAEDERRRADDERRRADEAIALAARLAAQLRKVGQEPEI
jgi:hypothetical protein